jgi:hypothetical protein
LQNHIAAKALEKSTNGFASGHQGYISLLPDQYGNQCAIKLPEVAASTVTLGGQLWWSQSARILVPDLLSLGATLI